MTLRRPRSVAALAVAMASLVVAPNALGAGTVFQSKRLWATINVCDTAGHPDGIGIRGSMPGSGVKGERMLMRFEVQYRGATGRWRSIGAAGASDFVDVGAATFRARQSGLTFTITPPPAGAQPYLLRGVVTFEWRRKGEVVRRARKATTAGHPNTRGADPEGFSAATCRIA